MSEVADVRHDTSGFRVFLPAANDVGVRVALVHDFDGPSIGELTVHAGMGTRYFGAAVDLTGVAGTSELWSDAGWGNAVLNARWLVGGRVTNAIGLRGTAPLAPFEAGGVAYWGTLPSATIPTWGLALAYEAATEHVVFQVRTGFKSQPESMNFADVFDGELGFVYTRPITASIGFVGEVELTLEDSPAHVRALARFQPGAGVDLDAGLAIAPIAMVQDPTLQVLLAARKHW